MTHSFTKPFLKIHNFSILIDRYFLHVVDNYFQYAKKLRVLKKMGSYLQVTSISLNCFVFFAKNYPKNIVMVKIGLLLQDIDSFFLNWIYDGKFFSQIFDKSTLNCLLPNSDKSMRVYGYIIVMKEYALVKYLLSSRHHRPPPPPTTT